MCHSACSVAKQFRPPSHKNILYVTTIMCGDNDAFIWVFSRFLLPICDTLLFHSECANMESRIVLGNKIFFGYKDKCIGIELLCRFYHAIVCNPVNSGSTFGSSVLGQSVYSHESSRSSIGINYAHTICFVS